jgi:RimJ/RimL family protein N-acetyltransferase
MGDEGQAAYHSVTVTRSHIPAVITEDNLASQRLAAKLGFIAGDVGTYHGDRLVRHHITADLHARP